MKCPYCGAEVDNKVLKCEYCDSSLIPPSLQSTNQNNQGYQNDRNIQQSGNYQGGYYQSAQLYQNSNSGWKLALWIIGWFVFFPIPVMVLIWRDKCKWTTRTKVLVTVLFFLVLFVMGIYQG